MQGWCVPRLLHRMQSAHKHVVLQPHTLEAYQMLLQMQQWQACKVSCGPFHNILLDVHLEILLSVQPLS